MKRCALRVRLYCFTMSRDGCDRDILTRVLGLTNELYVTQYNNGRAMHTHFQYEVNVLCLIFKIIILNASLQGGENII